MVRRVVSSPLLSFSLALALMFSLLTRGDDKPARIIAFHRSGPERTPTLLLDLNAPLASAEGVTLEPHAPVRARLLTPYRLEIRPERPLERFTRYRVRLADSFADRTGRPVRAELAMEFTTGAFALAKLPKARTGWSGRAECHLEFNGAVERAELMQHLQMEIPFKLHAVGEDKHRWVVALEERPEKATLLIRKGLRPASGGIGTPKDLRARLTWRTDLVIDDVDVSSRRIDIEFSHRLADGDWRAFVELDPEPRDLVVSRRGYELRLKGAFVPGQRVEVVLKQGIRSQIGRRLKQDVRRMVRIPDHAPRLRFVQQGRTLSTAAVPELEIEGVNLRRVRVEIRKLYGNNIVPLALGWERAKNLSAPVEARTLRLDAKRNETWRRQLNLATLLGEQPRGIYELRLYRDDDRWRSTRRILQVTDLAPVVRRTRDALVVFVASIASGRPVAGAQVEAYDRKNQRRARGVTDADGIYVARGLEAEPFVVVAALGDDRAYVDFDTHAVAHAGKEVDGRPHARGPEAFLYADRGVVRPGGVARIGAIVRLPNGKPAAAGLPVTLRLIGSDKRVVRRYTRPLSEFGLATLEILFEADAPTGPYAVEALLPGSKTPIGKTTFRVEAFVPDRIEPALKLPDGDLVAGSTVDVGISAKLLAGPPAAGRRARLRVTYVGRNGADFTAELADVVLDDRGQARASVHLPDRRDLDATFLLEVIDLGGRAAFTRAHRRVRYRGPRLVIEPPADSFELRVDAKGGRPGRIGARLERLEWDGAFVRERGRTVWRAILVARTIARAEVSGGLVRFEDPGDGRYRVTIKTLANQPPLRPDFLPASVRFLRAGGRTHRDEGTGAPRLPLRHVEGSLVADAPFAGVGLLTLEGPGLLVARKIEIARGIQRIALDLPKNDAPNIHATLTVVGRAARFLGAVAVPLAHAERRVAVQVRAPARVAPDSELVVTLATDAPAEVVLYAVDEGVLRRTGHASPDPAAHFLGRRALETRIADAYARLLEGMRFSGDSPEPGGDADGGGKGGRRGLIAQRIDATARATIETVALASKTVRVDGRATVRLKLPPFEGRLRLFAVAAGARGTGAADASVVVRGPVSVAIHLPRAVAPGDEFVVPLRVRGEGTSFEVSLKGLLRLKDQPLTVRALEPGVAEVTVEARDRAGNTLRRTAKLRVRPPAPFTVRHVVTSIKRGAVELPGRWQRRKARVRIGGGDADLLPALERLLEYPHGCVEQTTSRAFPLLAWSHLHPDGGVAMRVIDHAIDRLWTMQTSDGGLAVWPGGDRRSRFGSIYAAHFLLEARKAGRPVDGAKLEALLEAIEEFDGAGSYAALVLSVAGRETGPRLERLAEQATDAEDCARLAAAFLYRGDRARAETLARKAGDPWKAPRESGGRLSSPVRAAATLLAALAEVAPNDPRIPELALRLRRAARAAARRTTQENAAALLALAKAGASVPNDLRGELILNGKTHAFDATTALDLEIGAPWRVSIRANRKTAVVLRIEGIPLDTPDDNVERGLKIARRIEGGPFRQGRVYRVVISGTVPRGTRNLLVTDLLAGGFEIEAARDQQGSLDPDRVEPRDDRVLFFRTASLAGEFKQVYLVRAVTVGRFALPPVRAELLYDPQLFASAHAGTSIEIKP